MNAHAAIIVDFSASLNGAAVAPARGRSPVGARIGRHTTADRLAAKGAFAPDPRRQL